MKFLVTIQLILVYNFCFSQESLDSSIKLNNHQYKISANYDDSSTAELNSSVNIFRDGKRILSDSLWCSALEISFYDINKDGFKDLLVYQTTGARANETFYLYIFQKQYNNFKKVKGFEDWPNLDTTKLKGILASTILTGTVEYHFFKLTDNGKLIDLKINKVDNDLSGEAYDKGLLKAKKLIKK